MAFSFILPNYSGNTAINTPSNRPASGTGNVSASSVGTGFAGAGGMTPNLASAAPGTVGRFMDFFSDYGYSFPGGGYQSSADLKNANSYYNKFGGSDPVANKAASELFGYLGSLPTMPAGLGSNALSALYARGGGGIPSQPTGPSINSILGRPWQGPYAIKPSQFNSTPVSGSGINW